MEIARLSPTSLTAFLRCSRMFYYRHIQKIPSPVKGIMVAGRVAHQTIEYGYQLKMYYRVDPTLKDLRQHFEAAWQKESKGEVLWDKPQEELKINTWHLVEIYAVMVMPKYEVAAIEERRETTIAGIPYVGYLDLKLKPVAANENRIIDIKLRQKSISQNEADHDLQITSYGLLLAEPGKEAPPLVAEFHVLLMQKKLDVRIVVTSREQKDYDFVKEQVASTKNLINRAGEFIANTTWWGCTEYDEKTGKGCYYWDVCHLPKGF